MERPIYQVVCISPGWLVTNNGHPSGQILSSRADAIRAGKKKAGIAYPSKLIIRDEAGDIDEEILYDGPGLP